MLLRIQNLFLKEYYLKIRQCQTIIGIFLFSVLFSILLAFLLRHLSVRVDELGIIALPAFWIIFLSTVFRYSLHSYSEEIHSGIFKNQILSGYRPGEIFYVKLFVDCLFAVFLLSFQFLVFFLLLGIPQAGSIFLQVFLGFLVSLPAVISITSLGACMSHRSGREEILMPILAIPLLLLISVSVVSYGEEVFRGNMDFPDSFWLKACAGMSLIMISVSGFLFNAIISIRE